MNKIKIAYPILAISFGIFMFVYGGWDDSPGAQLLGVLAVIFGVVSIVKSRNKTSET